ncbi:activating signal cointegrator 1 complex subunit 3, partial [Kickxella alabastrina]
PVLIFVSSRRQTRLTAQDLIAFCGVEDNPRHLLHMDDAEADAAMARAHDAHLRLALGFGIGMHHAGLAEADRVLCEELFLARKIQVLIATSTLAWGVNLPAHLVILKGTEFYDAKAKGYVDLPITDVLQMIGRAGRPQFDDRAVARIFVSDGKKEFYKRFLHEPFPVESSLHRHLHEHINAEVAAGAIGSAQDAVDYLSWTYLFRRLRQNPSYYGVEDASEAAVNRFLSRMVMQCFADLHRAQCIALEQDGARVAVGPTPLGRIASQYYLSHTTMLTFATRLPAVDRAHPLGGLLHLLSDATEWAEIPVRHNEDLLNRELERSVPYALGKAQVVDYLSPHAKTCLLVQKHMVRGDLPCSDYVTDTRTVLDSSIRILQAMVDVAAYMGLLAPAVAAMELMQAIKQASMPGDSPLCQISPGMDLDEIKSLFGLGGARPSGREKGRRAQQPRCLGSLLVMSDAQLRDFFAPLAARRGPADVRAWCEAVRALPPVDVTIAPGTATATATADAAREEAKMGSFCGLLPTTQYSMVITLTYTRPESGFGKPGFMCEPGQAYTPRFGKTQYEGWWVVLAQGEEELLAVKRVSMQGKVGNARVKNAPEAVKTPETRSVRLAFITPQAVGKHRLRLLLVSDAYLGLDQEFEVVIEVVGAQDQMIVPTDPSFIDKGQMTVPEDLSFISKEKMKEYQ